ncbi:MAG: ASCH domain-containing protein [Clostridia bacterium]|nr:ASCH domain-containing protein [Clostridia bacterium]
MLTLPIKRKWFDMIVSGEKREEYRAPTAYWKKRFVNEAKRQNAERPGEVKGFNGMRVRIRAGYSRQAPQAELTLATLYTDEGHAEWGAEPGVRYLVLFIKSVEVLKE